MASEIPRREQPKRFLDASTVPVERALLERARVLSENVLSEPGAPDATDEQVMAAGVLSVVRATVAAELLALAQELHYW